MRTTLNISNDLIIKIKKISGINSKTKIIENALKQYLAKLQRNKLKSGFGKLSIDLDVKEFRKRELNE